jgi:hypothetical protein
MNIPHRAIRRGWIEPGDILTDVPPEYTDDVREAIWRGLTDPRYAPGAHCPCERCRTNVE